MSKKRHEPEKESPVSSSSTPATSAGNSPPVNGNIDFSQILTMPDVVEQNFPCKESVEYRIFLEKSVYDEIIAHSKEDKRVELCGVLVGKICKDALGPYLLIDRSIRGVGTKNEGAQVTFTHATWDHIHKQMDEKHQGKKIIGWYHTHPGFGIFLSDMDKFIHEYFFNQAFQVAMVVDPIASREGIFAWVGGRIQPLTRCWIGDTSRSLTQGSVGSDAAKVFIEGMMPKAAPDKITIGNFQSAPHSEAGSGDSINMYAVGLTFLLAFCLSWIWLKYEFHTSYRESARAEMRELFAMLGGSIARNNDLMMIDERLSALDTLCASAPVDASQTAQVWEQVKKEVTGGRLLLSTLASSTGALEEKLKTMLSGKAADYFTINERLSKINDEMGQTRYAVAMSYFLQAKIVMAGDDPSNPDPNRGRMARLILQNAIVLAPSLEPQCKSEFPSLYQNSQKGP